MKAFVFHGISVILQAFVEEGKVVAAFAPFFPPYQEMTHSWGGKWVSIPTLSNCRPSIEILEKYLREHSVSLFILNDPCNPSGVKLTRQELLDIAQVFLKPEFSHIIIILDEVYRELIFSEDKDTFLNVISTDWELFKSRCFIVLSLSKTIAGVPAMRVGLVCAPDMLINGKMEQMGSVLGILMTDGTTGVPTITQYITTKIINAKLGTGNPEWVKIYKNWERNAYQTYDTSVKLGIKLFGSDSHLPLVVKPSGGFFGVISARKIIGKKVPDVVKLIDGRTVDNLPQKLNTTHFKTDTHIGFYMLYAAEVVIIPASGFSLDPTEGYSRISFAVSKPSLEEASKRLNHAIESVLNQDEKSTETILNQEDK